MKPTPGSVLLFNPSGTAKSAAKLHALGCSMLQIAGTQGRAVPGGIVYLGKRSTAVSGDKAVRDEVDDLEERGYRVTECKCLARPPCPTCGSPDAQQHGDETMSVRSCDRCCDAAQRAGRYVCETPHANKKRGPRR